MLKTLLLALLAPLRWLARLLFALVILFEEWGWEWFSSVMAWVGRLPVVRHLEALIRRLPPYGALALFVLPTLLLLPVKLLALWFITRGRAIWGISVILLAKVLGTALLARIFVLVQPALMRLPWFERLYGRWNNWKQALLAWVRASPIWRQMHAWRESIRQAARRWREAMRRD